LDGAARRHYRGGMTRFGQTVRWVAALATAWVLGCGGGSASLDKPSAFCRAYDQHFGQVQWACVGGTGPVRDIGADNCDVLDAALAAGVISYDASAAAACLAEVDKGLGGACVTNPPCLSSVIKGHAAVGDACTNWMECPPGGGCGNNDGMSCPQHVCTAGGAVMGAACDSANGPSCVFGLECQTTASGTTGTCGFPAGGAACPNGPTDCQVFAEFCGTDGTCHARVPVGASCAADAQSCAILATCDPTSHLCVAAGLKGQSCGGLNICWTGSCFMPDANTAGMCKTALADGAACTDSSTCASGVCMGGTCATCP
jgi:hypothetical protein